jgi:hypothetical protein
MSKTNTRLARADFVGEISAWLYRSAVLDDRVRCIREVGIAKESVVCEGPAQPVTDLYPSHGTLIMN